jgi:putative oxidoreductase
MICCLCPAPVGGLRAFGLLVLRLVAGAGMMLHGLPKIKNPTAWMGPDADMPGILQAAAATAEFGGGLCWILGLLTPLASLLIICTMGVAVGMVHMAAGHAFVSKQPGEPSYELGAVYLAIAVALLLNGPGKLSIDAILFRKRAVTG